MSETLDSKVVEMRFDNDQFEENVRTTMSSLEKLKHSLKFEKTSKGFESIERAAQDTDISSLSRAAETVSVKFDAMQVAAVTAITNVVNSAMNAGEQLIKSLSVDNIADGWQKFADKTTSVGTLVAQGFNIGTVTKQLERLNWYTDETSYNFTDMVDNISKFTATGKGLKDSVTAMEGIANWAALSGQNAVTASRAMYQLSQAMGAGVMRLEDYKSIQNVSMDTDEFRQKALDAAVALGTLKKNADGTYTSLMAADKAGKVAFTKSQFSTNLTQGRWFTSDVMMKVFKDYSAAVDNIYEYAEEKGITASEAIEELGDKVDAFGLKAFRAAQEARTWADVIGSVKDAVSTGWMNTFDNIFGNYEEAKELWTGLANELYDVFAEGGNVRNELLAEWKREGGRSALIDAFWDSFHSLIEIIDEVKAAFHDIFPELTLQRLMEFTRQLRISAVRFKLTDNELNTLRKTFNGIFSILHLGIKTIKALVEGLEPLVTEFENFANSSNNALVRFGTFMTDIDKNAEKMGVFETITRRTANTIYIIIGYLKRLVSNNVSDYMLGFSKNGSVLDGVLTAVAGNAGNLVRMIFDLISAITGIDLSSTRDQVVTFVVGISSAFATLIKNIVTAGQNIVHKISVIFNSVVAIISKGYQAVSSINSPSEIFSGIEDSISGTAGKNIAHKIAAMFDGVANIMSKGYQAVSSIKFGEPIKSPSGIFSGIGDSVFSGIEYIKGLFTKSEESSAVISEKSDNIAKNVNGAIDKFSPLKSIFDAVKPIGSMLGGLLSGLFGNLKTIIPDMKTLEKIIEAGLTVGLIYSLIKFAKAIGDFGSTIKKIAKGQIIRDILGIEDIIKSVKGVFDQTKELLEEYQNKIKTETFMNIATSIMLLCMSLYVLSTIPMDDLAKSLLGAGAVFAALMILFKQMTKFVSVVSAMGNKRKIAETANLVSSTGLSLFEIAGAVLLVSSSVAIMGRLDAGQLTQGMGAMFGIVLTLVGGLKLLQAVKTPHPKAILASTASLTIMAAALDAITPALVVLGTLDPKGLDNAWQALAKILSIMTLSLIAMNTVGKDFTGIQNAGKIVAASSAFAVMAAAVDMLIPFFAIVGALPDGMADRAFAAFFAILVSMTTAVELMAHIKGGITNPGKIVAVTSSFVIMAVAIDALIPALATIAAGRGWMVAAALEISTILLAMASSMAILNGFDPATMLKGTSAILIFSVALDALVPALSSLAVLNEAGLGGSIFMAIGELTAVLGVFMAIFAIFDAMNKANIMNTVDYVAAAGGIALMALALNALVPPLVILGGINLNEDAWKGIAMAIGEIAVIVGLMSVMLRSGGKDSLMGGAGLLAAATAISVLVPALIALGGASLSLIAIGPALAAFGAFAAVIAKLGPGLLTATPGMLAMAAALAALAFAMHAMGPALALLGTGIAAVVAGTIAGMKLLADHMDEFLESFRIILAGVTELLLDTVLAIILGVVRSLRIYGPDILKEVAILCTDVIQVLIDNVVPILGGLLVLLGAAIVELIEGLGAILDPLAQSIVDFVIALINAIANAIGSDENIEKFKAAMRNLVEGGLTACLALFGMNLDDARTAAQEFCDDMEEMLRVLYGDTYDGLKEIGALIQKFSGKKGATRSEDIIQTGKEQAAEKALRAAIAELPADKQDAAYQRYGIEKPTEPSKVGGSKRDGDMRVWDNGETYEMGVYDGEQYDAGFYDGVRNNIEDVTDATGELAQSAVDSVEGVLDINSPSEVLKKVGQFFTQGFALGIASSGGAAKLAARVVGNDASSEAVDTVEDNADDAKKAVNKTADKAVEDLPDKAEKTGENVVDSLWKGIKGSIDGVLKLFGGTFDLNTLLDPNSVFGGLSSFNSDVPLEYKSRAEYEKEIFETEIKIEELRKRGFSEESHNIKQYREELENLWEEYRNSDVFDPMLKQYEDRMNGLKAEMELYSVDSELFRKTRELYGPQSEELAEVVSWFTKLSNSYGLIYKEYTEYINKLRGDFVKNKDAEDQGEDDGNSYVNGFTTSLDNNGTKIKNASKKFWANFKLPDGSIFRYEFSSWDDYVAKGQSIGGFDNVAKAAFEHYNDEDKRSAFQSWDDDALEAQLDSAKEAYDKFFSEFEKGTISASEYERRFTNLLKNNVPVQKALAEYAAEKMSGYTKDALKDATDEYEKTLADITDKMDNFKENIGISWGDMFDFIDLKDFSKNLLGNFSDFFTLIDFEEHTKKIAGSMEDLFGAASDISGYVQNVLVSADDLFANVVDLEDYVENIGGEVSDLFSELTDGVKDYAEGLHASLESVVSSVIDEQNEILDATRDFVDNMHLSMSDAISAGIESEEKMSDNASSFASSMRKSMSDAFKFKTNAEYIEELNDKLEKTKELYGEDSNQVKVLERQIKNFTQNTKGKENEIYSVNATEVGEKKKPFGDSIIKETEMLNNYAKTIEKLKKRGISKEIMQMLSGMSREEGMAAAEYLANLDEETYRKFLEDWDAHKLASDNLGNTLFEGSQDTIADILEEDKIAIDTYNDELETLLGNSKREVSSAMLDMLKGMGRDEASKAMAYLNGLSDEEYNDFLRTLEENEMYSVKIANKLYKAEAAALEDALRADSSALDEYNEEFNALLAKGVSASVLDMIKGMSREEATQTMAYLNGLSKKEYAAFNKLAKTNEKDAKEAAKKMYAAEAETIPERLADTAQEIADYETELDKLLSRGISSGVLDTIKGMSREEATAAMSYLNSMSNKQYADFEKLVKKNKNKTESMAQKMYAADASVISEKLGDTVKSINSYNKELDTLLTKNVSAGVIDMLNGMSRDEATAVMSVLNNMTSEQYADFEKIIKMNKKSSEAMARKMYAAEASTMSERLGNTANSIGEYNKQLDILLTKNVSAGVLDMLKNMSREEATAAMSVLNNMSAEQLAGFNSLVLKNEQAAKKATTKMYEADAKTLRDRLTKESAELSEYNKELSKLVKRGLDAQVLDTIAGMSREEGLATIKYLNNLSDEEYAELMKTWASNKKKADAAAQTAYNASSGAAAVARFKTDLGENFKMLKNYQKALDGLINKGREMPDSLKEYIASLDTTEGLALIQFLGNLTDEEWENIVKKWKNKEKTEQDIAETLYGSELKDATTEYVNKTSNILNKLPESARETGKKTMKQVAEGMSEESESALESIDVTITSLTDRIIQHFDKLIDTVDAKTSKLHKKFGGGLSKQNKDSILNFASNGAKAGNSVSKSTKNGIMDSGTKTANAVHLSANGRKTIAQAALQSVDGSSRGTNAVVNVRSQKVKWSDSKHTWVADDSGTASSVSKDIADKINSKTSGSAESWEPFMNAVNNNSAILAQNATAIELMSKNMTDGFNSLGESFSSAEVVIDPAAATKKLAPYMNNTIGGFVIRKMRGI